MWNDNDLRNKLSEYRIEGDIAELSHITTSNAKVLISENDMLSVLSKGKTNYIRIGYGDSLLQTYKDMSTIGGKCRLAHIFFADRGMNFHDLSKFIDSFGGEIIFGYSSDDTIKRGVKLVMIFN